MIGALLPLLVAVPLVIGGALVTIPNHPRWNHVALMTTLVGVLAASVALVVDQVNGDIIAHGLAGWDSGIAIPFVADMFSALILTTTSLLALTCAVFAIFSGHADRGYFSPLVLFLVAGVNGALLTADLFNLFVFIEVMLLPSYGLLILSMYRRGTMSRLRGSRLFVTVNLLASTIFLAGVGFLYGVTGTVNLGELAGAASDSPAAALAGAVCLLGLSMKASVVPMHGWLARTYPSTSPAVTALFSGLHTKVAIYAIYRIYAVVFDGDQAFLWIGIVVFSMTMIIGVLGAVGENTSRSILTFHMVSQIGYILLGVALFGPLGLAAGIFYLIHNMVVKTSLFLSTGAVEVAYGAGKLGAVTGIAKREPIVAVAFFVAALSLAGVPPFSGFVAKFTLVTAAIDAGHIAAAVAMVAVSLLTLMSMLKIWSGIFWGEGDTSTTSTGSTLVEIKTERKIGTGLIAPAALLALLSIALGVGAELVFNLAQIAAAGLVDPSAYIEAVLNS